MPKKPPRSSLAPKRRPAGTAIIRKRRRRFPFAAAQVLAAFAELGLAAKPGDVLAGAAIEKLKASEPSGGRWTDCLIALLEETRTVEPVANGWRVLRVPSAEPDAVKLDGYETDIALFAEAGRTLAAALSGEHAGRDAVFTGDTLPLLTRFYSEAPASAFYNRILSDAVASLLARSTSSGALRVLEVGAGTGGATGAIVDRLPGGARYLFTDAAPLLLDAAKERFADIASLETRVFDLTGDASAQEIAPASFDLVVAANVVHATPRVGAALERLRVFSCRAASSR